MDINLFSVPTVLGKGFDVIISLTKGAKVLHNDNIIAKGICHCPLWRLGVLIIERHQIYNFAHHATSTKSEGCRIRGEGIKGFHWP
jgi:hypothetical protein